MGKCRLREHLMCAINLSFEALAKISILHHSLLLLCVNLTSMEMHAIFINFVLIGGELLQGPVIGARIETYNAGLGLH